MAHKRDEIADQLRRRITAGLHLGTVREGQRLPSVRSLAPEVDADPRVVLAAYGKLEEEGLVEVRPKSGVFVAADAVGTGDRLPQLAEWVVEVLGQALGRGVSPIQFPERVRRCLETVSFRTACIECNRDQIAGLCGELKRDYGLDTTGVEISDLAGATLPEAVIDADLLVTTSFHADEVERVGRSLGIPCILVRHRPDFLAEVIRFMGQGPLYFVATDERFSQKVRRIFAGAEGLENVQVLIVGRDDLAQIPDGAPTYVMPAARPQLGSVPLTSRLIPAPRVFSKESARELLSFIVRANLEAERGVSSGEES